MKKLVNLPTFEQFINESYNKYYINEKIMDTGEFDDEGRKIGIWNEHTNNFGISNVWTGEYDIVNGESVRVGEWTSKRNDFVKNYSKKGNLISYIGTIDSGIHAGRFVKIYDDKSHSEIEYLNYIENYEWDLTGNIIKYVTKNKSFNVEYDIDNLPIEISTNSPYKVLKMTKEEMLDFIEPYNKENFDMKKLKFRK